MPLTHAAFLVGALALGGIPPLSGFWSKDAIIAAALRRAAACSATCSSCSRLLGALLTGVYTFRLYFLVFHGAPSELVLEHAGRSTPTAERATTATPTAKGRSPC